MVRNSTIWDYKLQGTYTVNKLKGVYILFIVQDSQVYKCILYKNEDRKSLICEGGEEWWGSKVAPPMIESQVPQRGSACASNNYSTSNALLVKKPKTPFPLGYMCITRNLGDGLKTYEMNILRGVLVRMISKWFNNHG